MIFLCATNHSVNTFWLLRVSQKLYARTHGNILYQRRHQQNTPHHPAERLDQKANSHTCFGQRGNLQSLFTSGLVHSYILNKMYLLIHFNYNTYVSLYFYIVFLYNKFHFFIIRSFGHICCHINISFFSRQGPRLRYKYN